MKPHAAASLFLILFPILWAVAIAQAHEGPCVNKDPTLSQEGERKAAAPATPIDTMHGLTQRLTILTQRVPRDHIQVGEAVVLYRQVLRGLSPPYSHRLRGGWAGG